MTVVLGFPLLRSLGPTPKDSMFHTDWKKGTRLVDIDAAAELMLDLRIDRLAALARRAPLALAGAGATAQLASLVGAQLMEGDLVAEAELAGRSR